MRAKTTQKKVATKLRSLGWSYSEIQEKVNVSQSTLSLWLRDLNLTKEQKLRLKRKSTSNQHLGALANKKNRIKKEKKIKKRAREEIKNISKKDLFYIGVALYWAEGAKQKKHNPSERVSFNNSDPLMIKVYLMWLINVVGIDSNLIDFSIYSHNNIRDREGDVVKYWSRTTNFPRSRFTKIYYKKDKKNNYRKNKNNNYYGLLRVSVRKSTDLNRKISGWIEGICDQCQVV